MPLVMSGSIAAVLGLIGLLFIVMAVRNRQRAAASAQWPQTQGIVTNVGMKTRRESEGDDWYDPQVQYQYGIGEQQYQGNRIAFGSSSTSAHARAEEIINRYAVGTPVVVYYNPAQPQQAVLEPRATGGNIIFLIVGLDFVLFAGLFLFIVS